MSPSDHFEKLVGEHYESLYRFAFSLARSESDASDLTQQTFYVWATKGHQLRDKSKVKTWLFTTLHRAFLETRRKQTRFPHFELEAVPEELPILDPALANRLDSTQVLAALAEVDEIYRAAVALFYLDGWSYKEIAAILEAPIGTVKSRLARGITQLREIVLSGGSRLPSRANGRSSSNCHVEQPATASTPGLPLAGCLTRLAAGFPDHGYDEWDFSSTLLWEPIGAS